MITYTTPWPGLDVKVPKLHWVSVPWHNRNDFFDSFCEFNSNMLRIRIWCEENCRAAFYTTPSWSPNQAVQFEDSDDAEDFEKWVMWQTLVRS